MRNDEIKKPEQYAIAQENSESDFWHLGKGIKVEKRIDLSGTISLGVSLLSLTLSGAIIIYNSLGSHNFAAYLHGESITTNFDTKEVISKTGNVLPINTRISGFSMPVTIFNTGDAVKPGSVMAVYLTAKINEKTFFYKWNDEIVSGAATTLERTKEVTPFTLKPNEVKSSNYTFNLDTVNGRPYNADNMPTLKDIMMHESTPNGSHIKFTVSFKLLGQKSTDDKTINDQSVSCYLPLDILKGNYYHRITNIGIVENRRKGTYVSSCFDQPQTITKRDKSKESSLDTSP